MKSPEFLPIPSYNLTQLLLLKLMSEVQRRKYSQEEKNAIFDGEFMPHIDSMYNLATGSPSMKMMPKILYRILT